MHWGLNKMSEGLQTIFQNQFWWMKNFTFDKNFTELSSKILTDKVLFRVKAWHQIGEKPHWGRATHKCISKLTIIGSDNGLSPGRRQAIIWTNDGILLIRPLGTNFSEVLSKIHTFSFKKMHLKTSSAKGRPFCLGLNVLISWLLITC